MGRTPRELSGQVVVITGAGRGIGAATARALGREGARVVLADLDGDLATEVAAGIGANAQAHKLDVTDHAAFTDLLDTVEADLGPLDVLVNNAGIMALSPLDQESESSVDRQVDINLRAVLHGSQQAVRRMRPRGRGHLVNVASVAGRGGYPAAATYCATKFGVVGLSEALLAELHGTGVEVSCVMPALVRTELTDGVRDHWLIRTVTPEDVAAAIVGALKRPHFDVFVPRSLGPIHRSLALLPRRAQGWSARALKVDQVLASAAHSPARRSYEERALRG